MKMRKPASIRIYASIVTLFAAMVAANAVDAKVTLRLMARDGGTVVKNLQKVVERFEAANPDIKVRFEESTYSEYVNKLLTQVIARSAPDVVFSAMGNFRILVKGGALAPLDKFITADKIDMKKYYESAIESGRYGGKIYAWPYDGGSYALHYNRDLFNATGLTFPDESWTWDRVIEASKKLFVRAADGKVSRTGINDARYLWWYYTWLNGGEIVSKNGKTSLLSSEECIEAVRWLAELTNRTGLMSGGLVAPNAGFTQGKVGLYFEGRWAVPMLRTVKFNWDVAPAPKGKVGTLNIAFYSGFSMLSTTKHPREAWRLINYIGGEAGQTVLSALGQQVPSIRSLAESSVFLNSTPPANNRAYLQGMERARPWPTHYITLFGGRYNEIVDPLLAKVWAGKASPEQVLTKELDNRLNPLLARN